MHVDRRNRNRRRFITPSVEQVMESLAMPMSVDSFYGHYNNSQSNQLVTAIQVSADNSKLRVRADFDGQVKYELAKILLGQASYYNLEDNLFGGNTYTISLETQDKKLILFFISELIRISPGLRVSGVVQKLNEHHLRLSQAYHSINEIPVWDDYTKFHPLEPRHTAIYKNNSSQSKIRTIKIIQERNLPVLNIVLDCSSNIYFHELTAILVSNNIIDRNPRHGIILYVNRELPDTIQKLREFMRLIRSFETMLDDDLYRKICSFINAMSSANEPLISIINHDQPEVRGETMLTMTNEMFQSMVREITTSPTERPVWSRGGNWGHLTTNSVWGFLRQVSFTNPRIQSSVETIYLSEYTNGDFNVTLRIRPEEFRYFTERLAEVGIPRPTGSDHISHHISMRAHGSESSILSSFLMKAYEIDPDIESVFDEIIRIINEATRNAPVSMHTQTHSEPRSMQIDFRRARAFSRSNNAGSALMRITGAPTLRVTQQNLAGEGNRPLITVQTPVFIESRDVAEPAPRITTNPWVREGDFALELPNNGYFIYNRSALYSNTAESPLIRRVFIKQIRDNNRNIEIAITSGSNRFQELMGTVNEILEGGHRLTPAYFFTDNTVIINAGPAFFEHLVDFMLNLAMRAPELARIHGEIARGIRIAGQTTSGYTPNPPRADTDLQQAQAQSFDEHYGHTAATYRPSQTTGPGPTMPDIGANAKALEGMDVDVPEHLCCALSLQIMTDPVRFEGLANQDCFEDAWIMEHLRKNKTHPTTREAVSEKMLVSVLHLKRECDAFTEEKVKNHADNNMRITQ